MIKLEPFLPSDFEEFISWIDSKEILVTIAGTVFNYPLTAEQLQTYFDNEKSYAFNVVDTQQNKTIGHAELYLSDDGTCKIDKLLIGEKSSRGKGTGQQIIDELLEYSFTKLGVNLVELNVYDWNIAGIKCYEKSGFIKNPAKTLTTEFDDKTWPAFNMTIEKVNWLKREK